MSDSDVLDNNPHISKSALEAVHDQVFGWALSRCDYNRSIAEDLVQQAYVELLTGRAQFKAQSTLKTFVFGVVQNLAKSRYRRLGARLRLIRKVAQHDAGRCEMPPEASAKSIVWQAVQELPQRQRDLIELVFCRELTIEEASGVMGVTTGTGRVHYDRAKKALRTKLMELQ